MEPTIEVFAQPVDESKLFRAWADFVLGSGNGNYQLLVECQNPVLVYEEGATEPVGSANVTMESNNDFRSVIMDFQFLLNSAHPIRLDIEEKYISARPNLAFMGSLGGETRFENCVGPVKHPLVHYSFKSIVLYKEFTESLVHIVEE